MRLLVIVAALALAACNSDWNAPIDQSPRPGYPCGINGLVCTARGTDGVDRPTGACCNRDQTCGGTFPNVGCPDGWCCDDRIGAHLDGGPAPMTRQRPARR